MRHLSPCSMISLTCAPLFLAALLASWMSATLKHSTINQPPRGAPASLWLSQHRKGLPPPHITAVTYFSGSRSARDSMHVKDPVCVCVILCGPCPLIPLILYAADVLTLPSSYPRATYPRWAPSYDGSRSCLLTASHSPEERGRRSITAHECAASAGWERGTRRGCDHARVVTRRV